MKNVGKIIALCSLFFGSAVCQAIEIDCGRYKYGPVVSAKRDAYPYTVLIVRTKPTPISPVGGVGVVIAPLWVLTRASMIASKMKVVEEWGIAGASVDDIRLESTPIIPVESIQVNPFHEPSRGRSPFNLLLLRMKYTDSTIRPIVIPASNDIDTVPDVTYIYWKSDNGVYRKYKKPFCTKLRDMRSRCRFYNREPHLCLSTAGDGAALVEDDPCTANMISLGAPLISRGELLAIYMGIENDDTTGTNPCQKKSDKVFHTAIRIQLDYDPASPETNRITHWINQTEVEYVTTTIDTTTTTTTTSTTTASTRPRLSPKTMWEYCDSGGHRHVMSILVFAFVVFWFNFYNCTL